jgi:DNA-binding SARP family transcriptional activator/tetratricopeptide (TPR) repeat protein
VELGVLGPLQITSNDAELAMTSPRSRTFLAHLVLNNGCPVTLYELADAIWGSALPKNPRRAVQLCAVRVRALLERVGADGIVVTCPDGYRLDVPSTHTDLGRLKDWLREADEAAAGSDADRELAAVTAALRLWRGEPLADVSSEVLQREVVPALREQRLRLTQRRIDILLRSGNAAPLVDELVTLTARHPLREQWWCQLMQALYRCGRRGEALDAYHRFRRGLSEELGIDPSETIRGLHAAILTGQPEPAVQATSLMLPVPRELPPSVAAFAGRTGELAQLSELLAVAGTGPVVCVITGTAGVGKTTLAIYWARRVAEEFPDGQLFVDMRGYHPAQALSPHRVQARVLRTLGVRGEDIPQDPDELAGLYRSVMDGRRILMLLDNVNSSDQVRPLLPSTAGSLVVITSRDVLLSLIAADGARRVRLDLPSIAEARQMLARRLGPQRLSADPRAADDIITASARLPLAIAIAAARAVTDQDCRLSVVAAQLRNGLDAFGTASTATDIRSVFSWSYRALSPDAARLLRLMGLHPGPHVTAPAVASLGGLPPQRTNQLLDELVRAHLVVEQLPGRYALHDLMREYCVELVGATDTDSERQRAVRRGIDHYLHTGYAAASVLNPQRTELDLGDAPCAVYPEGFADYDAAMGWFAAEYDVLLAVADWAAGTGFDRHVWDLAWVMVGYLERQGNWTQWVSCQRAAIAAAQRLDDPILQARAHRGLGRAHARQARAEDAYRDYATALELYRDNGDLSGQARTETNLALLREQQGQYSQALTHARRALELQKQLRDGVGYANALNTAAWCYALTGQHRLALDHGHQAMAEHQELGDLDGKAATMDTIGYAHHQLGQFAEAVDSYQQAVRLYRQLGDRYYTAISLINLGDTYETLGDRTSAHDVWRQAEAILDDLRNPAAQQVRAKLRGVATKPDMTR